MADVNVRELVLESLIEIIENKSFSGTIENQVLEKYAYLDKRDRAFYTRMVEGTLGSLLTLDYKINLLSKTPVKKMKPLIRNLLRMSAYQILFMDNVPDSAAINEAVKLAKKRGFTQLSGFVNGVLRNLSRQKDSLGLPDSKNKSQYLSVAYSIPEWIVNGFLAEYGEEETESILINLNIEPLLSVRVNTDRISREDLIKKLAPIHCQKIKGTESGLYLSGYDRLSDLKSFLDGDFYVQDASSMMVAESAGIKEGDYVIDVCAAPGGKSTHAAQLLKGSGHVDARDLTDYKVSLIEENIRRLGLTNISAKAWDATEADPAVCGKADLVICDLPCSGLGVMGKKKDIRYNATPEGIHELAEIQRKILNASLTYLKEGGTLMYSTCTISKEENEGNTEWLLREHPELTLESKRQILPGQVGNDGFYLAKFVRK